jgi:YfiH family protein
MPAPLTASNLAALPGIRHGFFTRHGGVSEGIYAGLNCGLGSRDDTAHVRENRARVARHLGSPREEVVTLYQTHSADALVVEALPDRAALPKADAVVTRTPGLVVGALAADCAPVLLADAEARVVAAAHAGWRGAVGGILEAAITAMEGLGARRACIHAAVGPCIGLENYEVGPEFEADVTARDPASRAFFRVFAPGGRAHFDLAGYTASRLSAAGLASVAVEAPCTFTNESLFFSYRRGQRRREPDYGRQISAIVVA